MERIFSKAQYTSLTLYSLQQWAHAANYFMQEHTIGKR